MPYITNTRSVFGRLEDNHHHPFPDPLEDNDDDDVTPTPSPATARRRLPLSHRPLPSTISIGKSTKRNSVLDAISTKGTEVRRLSMTSPSNLMNNNTSMRSHSLNNTIRRAQLGQHLQADSEEFVSKTPPTRRRLGDELEGLQVQQVVDITTPPTATTAVATAVTASARSAIRKRRTPEQLAAIATRKRHDEEEQAAIQAMGAAIAARKRRAAQEQAEIEIMASNIAKRRRIDALGLGGIGGTPTSMDSSASTLTNVSVTRVPEGSREQSSFPYGYPCDGCKKDFCKNMRAVRTLKNQALKKFSSEVHDLPALIRNNGKRRNALFQWNKYNTGLSSIKKTPYCVIIFARKWFPEHGQLYRRAPPSQSPPSSPSFTLTRDNASNNDNASAINNNNDKMQKL